jgi:hypothetical protein
MAGTLKSVLQEMGDDGRPLQMSLARLTLIAGTLTVAVGAGWQVLSYARVVTGAGALGHLTVSITAGGDLTVSTATATDVSTVVVLLAKGGSPTGAIA